MDNKCLFKMKITQDNTPVLKIKTEKIEDIEVAFLKFKKKMKGE